MNILMLNHEFPPIGGGASPVTRDLCAELVKCGHSVDVVTMRFRGLPAFEQREGFGIYRTPGLRSRPDVSGIPELATYCLPAFVKALQLARRNRYDVIHCHFLMPGALMAYPLARFTGLPLLVTCHGSDVPGFNPDRFVLTHRVITPFWRMLVRRINYLSVPGTVLKQLILRQEPSASVQVIPNGVNTQRFRPEEKKRRILLCCRLVKRKGVQYVLEALNGFDPTWEIHVAGDGPYLSELRRIASTLGRPVKFLGWLKKEDSQLEILFNESAVFISVSNAESFGLTVAEAMAAGCAVIASDIPAHRELLHDAGIYVQPEDATAIKRALEKVTKDDSFRRTLQASARDRVERHFSWNAVIEQYTECYRKIRDENKKA